MKSLKKRLLIFYKVAFDVKKPFFWALLIALFGFFIRYISISPGNILFDYDQYEDLFHTKKIVVDFDLPIIGRPIYGDARLHHGVVYFYYNIIPFLLFKWNPISIALWNSVFNAGLSLILFLFARSLFKKVVPALIAAFIASVSYEIVQFSGWISSTTIALITVPLFFYGLWTYYQKKDWGLIIAVFFLGLSIQAEILYLYLIPIFLIYWLLFKPVFPRKKLIVVSIVSFLVSVSTLILTEIKLKFAGVRALANFSEIFDDSEISYMNRLIFFFKDLWLTFSNNLLPHEPKWGYLIGVSIIVVAFTFYFSKKTPKREKTGLLFLLFYFFSPVIMLFFGYHRQPWFLIGLLSALILLSSYVLSKIRYTPLIIVILAIITWSNLTTILKVSRGMPVFFKPETSSVLSSQIAVVDYTYQESGGEPFAINAVTYPLYHNAIWEYNYKWRGLDRYGYFPGWLGGDQVYPYSVLPKSKQNESYFYVIIDTTYRIPEHYKNVAKEWADLEGELIEEKLIGGFIVQKRKYYNNLN